MCNLASFFFFFLRHIKSPNEEISYITMTHYKKKRFSATINYVAITSISLQ
jgi:hypothetical protein